MNADSTIYPKPTQAELRERAVTVGAQLIDLSTGDASFVISLGRAMADIDDPQLKPGVHYAVLANMLTAASGFAIGFAFGFAWLHL